MIEEITPEDEKKYFKGTENRLIRYYYYLENGLNIVNEFKYLILGIIAIYAFFKLDNIIWAFVMFFPSLVILTIIGYYFVHRFAKVREWVNLRFSTHYGIKNFDYTKESCELLREIRDSLKK